MIEDFSGLCENLFTDLLDTFNMKDWGMSWSDFVKQFITEITEKSKEWEKEEIE